MLSTTQNISTFPKFKIVYEFLLKKLIFIISFIIFLTIFFSLQQSLVLAQSITQESITQESITQESITQESITQESITQEQVQSMSMAAAKIQTLAVTKLLTEQKKDGYWLYPSYIGTAFISQYWLVTHWLGFEIPDFNKERFKEIVFDEQLADGSWYYLPDEGITKEVDEAITKEGFATETVGSTVGPTVGSSIESTDGSTGATVRARVGVSVLNYWALKTMGLSVSHPRMLRAKQFILKHGGLEASSSLTKILLMAFGNLKWGSFPIPPNVPFVSLKDQVGFINSKLALWMRAYVPPIAYLAELQVQKSLGPLYDLAELALRPSSVPKHKNYDFNLPTNFTGEKELAKFIFNSQRVVAYSWGGSTPATLLSMMVMEHAQNYMPEKRIDMQKAIKNGLTYVHNLSLNSEASSYRGVIFDGRYWDTVLIGGVLLEAGVPNSTLYPVAKYIDQKINRRTGGLSFGLDFEPDMDTDDTAEMLIFFKRGNFFSNAIYQGIEWLSQMQNDEDLGAGGWGAFSKNNNPVGYLKQITEKFRDSTEIYDPATPDVTGHILEAFGLLGFSINNDPTNMVNNAVEYMRNNQNADGTWFGRWGVNSIYGTGLSIVGLREVGVRPDDIMIQRGLTWLSHCQKKFGDGGFGESFFSYANPSLDCLNAPSSPTQTAWALLALLKVKSPTDPEVLLAVKYLLNTYQANSGWRDTVITGTAHPGVLPLFYPSYAKIFPLQAIVRWQKAISQLQQ